MKKVVMSVLVILFLLTAFEVTICQAQGGNATIDRAEAFTDDKGQVTVYGNISSGPGQPVTVAVIAPDGGIVYTNSVLSAANGDFTFSYRMTNGAPGTYKVRLGGSVAIPVTLTFYSPVALVGVGASLNGSGWVVVSGLITSGAGRHVTIDVTAPDGRPDYVDSMLSQDNGMFLFSYPLTSKIIGTYHVKIGADGVSNPATASFSYGCKSDDATLKDLELSAGSLDQAFAPETTGYTATVPVDVSSLAVIPVTSDVHASVKVNNESVASGSDSQAISLAAGATTTINIVVTAQDGVTTNTYTVNITRGYTLSDVTAQLSQDNQVTVTGRISAGAGQAVSVVITDPNGNYQYVNSTLSTSGGDFSFSYPRPANSPPGTYTVKVGGKNVATPVTTSFTYVPPIPAGGGGGGGFVPTSAEAVNSNEIVLTFSKAMNLPDPDSLSGLTVYVDGTPMSVVDEGQPESDQINLYVGGGGFSAGDTISLKYSGTASSPITAADGTPVANFTMPVTNDVGS